LRHLKKKRIQSEITPIQDEVESNREPFDIFESVIDLYNNFDPKKQERRFYSFIIK